MDEILTQLVIPLLGAFVIGLVVGYLFFRAGRAAAADPDSSVKTLHEDLRKKTGEADAYKTRAAEFRALLSKRDAMVAERDHYLAELEGRLRATEAELVSQRMSNSGNHSVVSARDVETGTRDLSLDEGSARFEMADGGSAAGHTIAETTVGDGPSVEVGDSAVPPVAGEIDAEDLSADAVGLTVERDTEGFIDLREGAVDGFDWAQAADPAQGADGRSSGSSEAAATHAADGERDDLFDAVTGRLDPPLPRPLESNAVQAVSGEAAPRTPAADRPVTAAHHGAAGHAGVAGPVVGPISPAVADEIDPADVTLESPVDSAWLLRRQTERRQVGEPPSVAGATRGARGPQGAASASDPRLVRPQGSADPVRQTTPDRGPTGSAAGARPGGVALLEPATVERQDAGELVGERSEAAGAVQATKLLGAPDTEAGATGGVALAGTAAGSGADLAAEVDADVDVDSDADADAVAAADVMVAPRSGEDGAGEDLADEDAASEDPFEDDLAADVTAERLFVADFDDEDDLIQIVGIGPKINGMLKERGITTFRQVAQLTQEQQEELDDALGAFRGRIERQGWVGQAYRLHQQKYHRTN